MSRAGLSFGPGDRRRRHRRGGPRRRAVVSSSTVPTAHGRSPWLTWADDRGERAPGGDHVEIELQRAVGVGGAGERHVGRHHPAATGLTGRGDERLAEDLAGLHHRSLPVVPGRAHVAVLAVGPHVEQVDEVAGIAPRRPPFDGDGLGRIVVVPVDQLHPHPVVIEGDVVGHPLDARRWSEDLAHDVASDIGARQVRCPAPGVGRAGRQGGSDGGPVGAPGPDAVVACPARLRTGRGGRRRSGSAARERGPVGRPGRRRSCRPRGGRPTTPGPGSGRVAPWPAMVGRRDRAAVRAPRRPKSSSYVSFFDGRRRPPTAVPRLPDAPSPGLRLLSVQGARCTVG